MSDFKAKMQYALCTKLNFGWNSAPDPAGGAYSAPQTLYLELRGLLLRRWDGKGGMDGEEEFPLFFLRIYAHDCQSTHSSFFSLGSLL